ncbi:molecular chaperone DnaK, heat shock protein hsp70 [Sphaerospermopsis reniformis]|uniref:Molecular chaperone DnaK, heat shock protein hsp70 n=1 Tax=Sphaerospermopsis reniformis TaxID=531300 RepID=A0A480A5H6_9CYAN|nr:Hsp70 family protein [Sphaerospermopsis reniformis]GCL38501.1 molecular chaperone DnaK, heat shock protein hsp70 [Sphaerospermopsis reniformis]
MSNVAILLDLDNIRPELQEIEDICRQYGNIKERRAFSNTPALRAVYGSRLRALEYRFELTPGVDIVRQEVDNLIFRTAEELINNSRLNIKIIAVVSNDNDYANLFASLKKKGIKTVAIGNNQIGNRLRETADYIEFLTNVLKPTYLGIDLGTTNTVIAQAKQALIQKLAVNAIGVSVRGENGALQQTQLIPSSVRFSKLDNSEIGKHVRSQYYAFRDQTILAWKHDIGTLKDGKPFEYELTIGKIKPEQAASEVLKFCRKKLLDFQVDLGGGVVITHPASYEPDAIKATREAAKLAGWKEDDIVLLPEPKAALYDFLHGFLHGDIFADLDTSRPLNILVYDLGGGTLDTSLHKVEWNSQISQFLIDDIAIGSRTRVGGDQVDERIVDYLFAKNSKIQKLSAPDQKKLWHELRIYAEKFKQVWGAEYLSYPDKEEFSLPFDYIALDGNFSIFYKMNYRQMQEALKDLLCLDIKPELIKKLDPKTAFDESPFTDRRDTFVVPVLDVLLKAKDRLGSVPKVDAILLNGGMTYFPLIRERLERLLPGTLILSQGNPDLAVARGAALYASGTIKGENINPTSIWLEVQDPNSQESKLELLIPHGQKYPYRTTLNGFRLPEERGLIEFKVWVGEGSKPNQNTTLQRIRCVHANEIRAANIQPGDYLNLEVEYTFDERLWLTLVHRDRLDCRFQLVVEDEPQNDPETNPPSGSTGGNGIDIDRFIPDILRARIGIEIDPSIQVQFTQWGRVSLSLSQNPGGNVYDQINDLEKQTLKAANRLSIVQSLLQWLEIGNNNTDLQKTRQTLAVRALSNIIQALPSDAADFQTRELEQRYHSWILRKFESGLSQLLSNDELYSAIAHTPGKLLWSDFGELIYQQFSEISNQARAVYLLNSFGICAEPSSRNITRLQSIIQANQHLALRQKAFWALARIISLGQPPEWRATINDVEKVASFVLDQLKNRITEPQVAIDALVCLSQCLLWHLKGHLLHERIVNDISSLGKIYLPCQSKMEVFKQIKKKFDKYLDLIEKMTNIETVTEEDEKEIKRFLELVNKT